MPSLDPIEVKLFVSSICIFVIQAHFLFPPPLLRWQSPLPFTCPARIIDWPIHHVSKDCVPPDVNIVQDGTHPALFEYVGRTRIHPPVMRSLLWLAFLSHVVCCANMEPLQPRQCGCQEVPCLAAVKEERLHDCLVELGAYLWWSVLCLYLAYSCPQSPCFLDLTSYCPDVTIVLGQVPSKISEHIYFLQ
jgi:hypothetical protein